MIPRCADHFEHTYVGFLKKKIRHLGSSTQTWGRGGLGGLGGKVGGEIFFLFCTYI